MKSRLARFCKIGELEGWNGSQRSTCGSGVSYSGESSDSSPQTDRNFLKTDPVQSTSPAMDPSWLMLGLELPMSRLKLFLHGLGLYMEGNIETLRDRLIRFQDYKRGLPGVHWDPAVDEGSSPGDDPELALLSERVNRRYKGSCQNLIEPVDDSLGSNICLVQELVFGGGSAKHETHKSELVNDSSSTMDGVLLDHAKGITGPPIDNDGKSVYFESPTDQFVTCRDLDVAIRTLESKIEDCFAKLQQVPIRDSAPLKDLNNRVFKRRRRRFCNNLKKPSDGTIISDEAVHNLTTEYTNGGNASTEVSTSTFSSNSSNQKDRSSDDKSKIVKKRRHRRRRPFKKSKISRVSLVASNVVNFS
ncbi:hypothetical protein KQX54_004810 [Cotesia glomerata]|uniref:Uncharacterized protein n=1 Tax=Cotesia glomerata TaxID=32391 RepID=A0AAV7IPJ6_COTGL|nr:hypothetical protein KQX54_004810 [Cotesia glomerata]